MSNTNKIVKLVSSGTGATAQTISLADQVNQFYQSSRKYVLTFVISAISGSPTNVIFTPIEVLSGTDTVNQTAVTATGASSVATAEMSPIGVFPQLKIEFTAGTSPSVDYKAYITSWEV